MSVAAGPELDVLVAQMILGYVWSPMSETNGSFPGYQDHASLYDPAGRVRAQRWKKDGKLTTWCCDAPELPRFSSHIDAAWQVVDRLAPFAPVIFKCAGMMLGESGRPEGGEWGCRFDCSEDRKESYALGYGETPAEAICRAGLEAIERKIKQGGFPGPKDWSPKGRLP